MLMTMLLLIANVCAEENDAPKMSQIYEVETSGTVDANALFAC